METYHLDLVLGEMLQNAGAGGVVHGGGHRSWLAAKTPRRLDGWEWEEKHGGPYTLGVP